MIKRCLHQSKPLAISAKLTKKRPNLQSLSHMTPSIIALQELRL